VEGTERFQGSFLLGPLTGPRGRNQQRLALTKIGGKGGPKREGKGKKKLVEGLGEAKIPNKNLFFLPRFPGIWQGPWKIPDWHWKGLGNSNLRLNSGGNQGPWSTGVELRFPGFLVTSTGPSHPWEVDFHPESGGLLK